MASSPLGARIWIRWRGRLIDHAFVARRRIYLGSRAGPDVDFVVPILAFDRPLLVAEQDGDALAVFTPDGRVSLATGESVAWAIDDFEVSVVAERAAPCPRGRLPALETRAARLLAISAAAHLLFFVAAHVFAPRPEGPEREHMERIDAIRARARLIESAPASDRP